MYKADRALYIEGRCSNGGALTRRPITLAMKGERMAVTWNGEHTEMSDADEKARGHRRGSPGAGDGRRTGKGSVPRDGAGGAATCAGCGGPSRWFGSRKPKGRVRRACSEARGFDAGRPRAAERKAASRSETRKSKRSSRRDEKPRSAVGPRWRTDAPVEAGRAEEQFRRAQAARAEPDKRATANPSRRGRATLRLRRNPRRRRCPKSRPACRS